MLKNKTKVQLKKETCHFLIILSLENERTHKKGFKAKFVFFNFTNIIVYCSFSG